MNMFTRTVAVGAAALLSLVMSCPTAAAADHLPSNVFFIKDTPLGKCAQTDYKAPHYLRNAPCANAIASQWWSYDSVTRQVRNSRSNLSGKCLTAPAQDTTWTPLTMTTCDTGNPRQRWGSAPKDHNGEGPFFIVAGSDEGVRPSGTVEERWNLSGDWMYDVTFPLHPGFWEPRNARRRQDRKRHPPPLLLGIGIGSRSSESENLSVCGAGFGPSPSVILMWTGGVPSPGPL
ncbi:ricin-type beta-trefoil lectin domain protein [Streptomyces microflavus]|uniref:ricin-type beta-trefoil lectin domain protein n=1 Tax=Streptomyces microflavus TaxID=1919 RepID=UPI003446E9E1